MHKYIASPPRHVAALSFPGPHLYYFQLFEGCTGLPDEIMADNGRDRDRYSAIQALTTSPYTQADILRTFQGLPFKSGYYSLLSPQHMGSSKRDKLFSALKLSDSLYLILLNSGKKLWNYRVSPDSFLGKVQHLFKTYYTQWTASKPTYDPHRRLILGRGGSARCVKVGIELNADTFKLCAVKKLIDKPSGLFNIFHNLESPLILPIYHYLTFFHPLRQRHEFYISMELAERSLLYMSSPEHFPEVARLSFPEKKKLVLRFLDGVLYLHQHGLYHLDLKLENVFMSQGRLKIADFDTLTRETQGYAKLGTPRCGPPEIFLKDPFSLDYSTEKADTWCTGIVALELMTQRIIERDGYLSYLKTSRDHRHPLLDHPVFSAYDSPTKEAIKTLLPLLEQDPKLRGSIKNSYLLLSNIM